MQRDPFRTGPPHSPGTQLGILEKIGWDGTRSAQFAPFAQAGLTPGRITRVDGPSAIVLTESGQFRVEFRSQAFQTGALARPIPAVGDWVGVNSPPDGVHFIEATLPRTSSLARARNEHKSAAEFQVLAANVDVVFIVQASDNVNVRRAEREIAVVRASGALPVIVLSKADLAGDRSAIEADLSSVAPGVRVLHTSSLTGEGVGALARYAAGGKTLAFIGASGVGKSTLVNSLLGEEAQATQTVREEDLRGRHTTTSRNLFPLPGGGALVDTPGLRSVGLTGSGDAVEAVFSEISSLSPACRFRDCTHGEEPGCAVTGAVASGMVPEDRLESYQRLKRESKWVQSKTDYTVRSERKRVFKLRTRGQRQKEHLESRE